MIIFDKLVIASGAFSNRFTDNLNEKIQLDISDEESASLGYSQLNPDMEFGEKGRTKQGIAIRHKEKDWHQSIFSKALRKKDLKTFEYIANHSDYLAICYVLQFRMLSYSATLNFAFLNPLMISSHLHRAFPYACIALEQF